MPAEDFDLIIEPKRTEKNYWKDLWRYRELFYILAWRDLKVRYKQTVIGIAWSVLQPLLMMVALVIVFRKIAKMPTEQDMPYAILIMAGMLPWQFFSNSLTVCSNSLINSANIISKVYFPRLIIPISSIITSFVDFLITFVLLIGVMYIYHYHPIWNMLMIPVFLVVVFLASLGIGLYMATLNLKYRDFRYIVPFVVQFGFYISPVGFSSSVIPSQWRLLYSVNPMVGVIDGFRWCIMGGKSHIYWPSFGISLAVILFFLFFSIWHFRKTEKKLADYI